LEDINSSPAAFPFDKLEWMNGVYIRGLSEDELCERLVPFVAADLGMSEEKMQARPELRQFVPLIQQRLKLLNEAAPWVDFAFTDVLSYEPEMLVGKKMTASESLAALRAARAALAKIPSFDANALEGVLRPLAAELGLKVGQLLGILRVATTGKKVAPPLFGTLAILGRERVLERLTAAEHMLASLSS